MAHATPLTAETPPPSASQELQRPRRLSVTTANALTNFSALQAQFRAHRLVVFLDYDGTLTPIVRRPEDAAMSEDMRGVLRDLVARVPVAVVSASRAPGPRAAAATRAGARCSRHRAGWGW